MNIPDCKKDRYLTSSNVHYIVYLVNLVCLYYNSDYTFHLGVKNWRAAINNYYNTFLSLTFLLLVDLVLFVHFVHTCSRMLALSVRKVELVAFRCTLVNNVYMRGCV